MNSKTRLFLGCFMALIATAFGFIIRALILEDWRLQFNLTGQQLGNLGGVGLYPFAISIILFSLIIDKIGYGRAMIFAFVGHAVSAVLTIRATTYQELYWATFILALANGTVEAVINPVVATVYDKNKTHWLNILHAGWPGGLVLGGLLVIAMGKIAFFGTLGGHLWQWKIGLVLLPTLLYGILLLGVKFPVQERVEAGVSYLEMLREFGAASCYIVSYLLIVAVNQMLTVAGVPAMAPWMPLLIALIPAAIFGAFVRTLGRPMFVFLMLVMFLLATTELGTDSWIADIMSSVLASPVAGALVLVYTSFIMFVLRFFAGPIVHRISPLGLLLTCAAIATAGLLLLSNAGTTIWLVFLAATCYGVGKTFFWPTTLGVVTEQYPKGGALLLNAIAGVGMLSVGVLGGPIIGALQDSAFVAELKQQNQALYEQVTVQKDGIFGKYTALNSDKFQQMRDELAKLKKEKAEGANSESLEKQISTIEGILVRTKQGTLSKIAILPAIMFCCYLILILYFKTKGGYKAQVLTGHGAEDEKFTGGVAGPVEA